MDGKKIFFIFLIFSIGVVPLGIYFYGVKTKKIINHHLLEKDIQINGNRPWDIKVYNNKIFDLVASRGSLGLGESYINGWWDCEALDQFFYKLLTGSPLEISTNLQTVIAYLNSILFNLQTKVRAQQVAHEHYDLGNDIFEAMLDPYMQYSCAYWLHAKNLHEAQEHKLALICKKLLLKPNMRVLDIGCGWGGLSLYMAKHYNVQVVGITISQQQADYARKLTQGYPVEIRLQDYRDINETFDRVVSVGMFEHVGYKNYRIFMQKVHKLLTDDGLFLLHTIGSNTTQTYGDPWITKYIFPNGMLPSIVQIGSAIEHLFVLEDWHNFGADYDKTLMAWYKNFEEQWPTLKDKYGPRFYRIWKYYLLSCAGLFRARQIQLWQLVLSKRGILGGYHSIR